MTANPRLQAALEYAQRGWPVFPVYEPAVGGSERCSCNKTDCSNLAKHPRTRRGFKDATTVEKTIRRWWKRWPRANVGIRTGEASGIVVLDVDPRHGGDETFKRLCEIWAEPRTITSITGSGGHHFCFAHPGHPVANCTALLPGLDIRGDGGYIVASPSRQVEGGVYRWVEGFAPGEIELAAMPQWLLALVRNKKTQIAGRDLLLRRATAYAAAVPGVEEGRRNSAAFGLAGHLAAFQLDGTKDGLTEAEIADLVVRWNQRNSPPLEESEVRTAARSAMENGTPRATKPVRQPESKTPRLVEFAPFPLDAFPGEVAKIISVYAESIGCDPVAVAFPSVAAAAAAIGNTRELEIKQGWCEPPIVWPVVVSESGTQKSPALDAAIGPTVRLEQKAVVEFGEVVKKYKVDTAVYEKKLSKWKKNSDDHDGSIVLLEPVGPVMPRYRCSDATVEAIAPLSMTHPRGLLLARDELDAWFGGFNQFKGGKGADVPAWLEMYGARPLIVDRKTAAKAIYVPRAAVCITGTIQPAVLARTLQGEHLENGLSARLMLAYPPRRQRVWTDKEVAPEVEEAFDRIIGQLYNIPLPSDNKRVRVTLAPAARELFIAFYNENGEEQVDLHGPEAAAWSKFEGIAARIALVFQLLEEPEATEVAEGPMQSAIRLVAWCKNETTRIYGILEESEDRRQLRQRYELIRSKYGGRIDVRTWHRRNTKNGRTADMARAELEGLCEAGLARWESSPGGKPGRPPSAVCVLIGGEE